MNGIYLLFLFVAIVTAKSVTEEVECVDNPDCPNPDLDEAVNIPYESDCHKFYKCNRGQACLMTCPEYGNNKWLVYNPESQTCDWPQNVPNAPNCDNSAVTTTTTTTANPQPPPPADECPKTGHDNIRDPSNCSYYFECNNGVPTRRKCEKNTVFNPSTRRCDSASNVSCTTN